MRSYVFDSSLLVISLWNVVLDVAQSQEAPVHLSVYYEALCPDSRYFVTQTLHNALSTFPETLSVKYIPFGKAHSNLYGGFDCQHGPDECKGNIVQSCALARLVPGKSQDDFVYCSMLYPRQYERCVAQSGLSWTDVQACSESPEGDELQRSSEILTKTNTDGPTFVPSVTVNNDPFDKRHSSEAYADLEAFLCKHHYSTSARCSQKNFAYFF